MPTRVQALTADDEDAFFTVWHSAIDARRGTLGRPLSRPSGDAANPPRLASSGVFGVGIFDGVELVSAAVAMPARSDDGRSPHEVPGLAHVSSVATVPHRWGEGLAGTAVRAVMWAAVARGYARVQLWTHAANPRAHKLYEREGFVPTGREKLHDAHDDERIVHYLRELPTPRLVLGRRAARVLCLDEQDRVLLMHWHHPISGHQLWEPPGGGIKADESPREAVLREWREETGLALPTLVGEPTLVARDQLWGDARFVGDEVFFLGRYDERAPGAATSLTLGEQTSYLGQEWVGWRDLVDACWRGDAVEPDVVTVLARLAPDGPWTR